MQAIAFAIDIAGDDPRVERIGLAALADATGVVRQVLGVDHIGGVTVRNGAIGKTVMIAAGRLHADHGIRRQRLEPRENAFAVVTDGLNRLV